MIRQSAGERVGACDRERARAGDSRYRLLCRPMHVAEWWRRATDSRETRVRDEIESPRILCFGCSKLGKRLTSAADLTRSQFDDLFLFLVRLTHVQEVSSVSG